MALPRTVFSVAFILLLGAVLLLWWQYDGAERGIWRFNFTPAGAPGVDGFIAVSGDSEYLASRGYGWLDATGSLQRGKWPPDKDHTWESRDQLNLILRHGPDDLARSFATGSARFAVDLEAGHYEVWVLSGDAGRFEHTPWQPYRILVEGREAYRYEPTAEHYHQQFDTPAATDDLGVAGVWQRYVEPRFVWSKLEVDVADGQLDVVLAGVERDRSKAGLAGDYPYTENGRGPQRRFTGSINALVVIARDVADGGGAGVMDRIEAWRQQNFNSKWPLLDGETVAEHDAVADKLPYRVSIPHHGADIFPGQPLPHQPDILTGRASPGELVSLTLAIRPLIDLGETKIEFSELRGPGGVVDTGTQLDAGVVRHAARMAAGRKRGWRPTPAEIIPADSWRLRQGINRQFWLNYRIPDGLAPGRYRGAITVRPENADATRLEVELEVLPFKLQRPTHLALGMTYFSPVQDAWFDESRFWQRITAEFDDMRRQGFTTVQYTGVGIHDYDRLDRVMQIYRAAGFPQPLVLLESYGAMDRLRRDGIPWDTEAFYSRYQQSIRELLGEAGRRQWPPLIINFGDEFTNSALEEFGVKVARSLKQIPGIITSADTNGDKEVRLLAPEVDILVFNNGWAGPERVNGEKKLLNAETVGLIKSAGTVPWLVNVGTDRFSNGYWLWKMVGLGVRGKLEWIYRSYKAMPHNPFDGDPLRPHLVYPGPEGSVLHTLEYERMRMGLDDLAYLYTLEQVLAAKRQKSADNSAVMAAEAFLSNLDASIDDDFNTYLDDETRHWPASRYDALRDEVIDHILRLQSL